MDQYRNKLAASERKHALLVIAPYRNTEARDRD